MGWRNESKSISIKFIFINRLIVANRATNNKHAAELEALEKQIIEWKARIASESNQ